MSDALALWSPSLNTAITSLSWSTVPPGSSADVQLRVKNLSAVYTASTVQFTFTGADANQFYISGDGTSFAGVLDIGDLRPYAITPLLTVRRVTPSTATSGAGNASVRLLVAGWTSG